MMARANTRLFFIALFLALAVLAFVVVRPFIAALLGAGVLAYVFFPLYRLTTRAVRNRYVSAFLVSLLIILIISAPLALLANNVTRESNILYLRAKQKLITGDLIGLQCAPEDTSALCKLSGGIERFLQEPEAKAFTADLVRKSTSFFGQRAQDLILSVPRLLLNLFITIFTAFYLFIEGPRLVERVRRLVPLKKSHQDAVFKQIDEVMFALIFGSIIVALIQGAAGALGFWLFKVPSPLLWGLVMAVTALIPVVGTAVIWLPAALLSIASGYAAGDSGLVGNGVGLLLFGMIVISQIDNILKPLLIGSRARMHPVLILIGALGGLATFGLIGFVIGPLALALFRTFFELYEQERQPGHTHG